MGFFAGNKQVELHPVSPPIGIYPNFVAKQQTMLTLKEHAFSFSGVSEDGGTWSVPELD